jgi:hypothetical protein
VCDYNGVAGRAVRRGKQLSDLVQRHLQFTKALDHLRLRNLAGQIAPVTATGIDFGRLQEARVCRSVLIVSNVAREKSPIVSVAGVAGMASVCTLPLQESQPSKKGLSLPSLEAGE